MAINYELLNKGGISLGTNFELLSEKPLDSRLVVPSLSGLQNYIDNAAAYAGMIVYVSDVKKTYQVVSESGALTYKEIVLKTEEELKNLITSETTAAMEFKGVATELPANPGKGDFYKVTAEFEVNGETVKLGDSIVYDGSQWFIIPSGDDIEDTWRPIANVNNDATLSFADGDKIEAVVAATGEVKFNHEKLDEAAAATKVANTTRTYVTEVDVDEFGHVTGYKVAEETVDDTNTTYTLEGQAETSSVYVTLNGSDDSSETVYLDAYSKNEADAAFDAKDSAKNVKEYADQELAKKLDANGWMTDADGNIGRISEFGDESYLSYSGIRITPDSIRGLDSLNDREFTLSHDTLDVYDMHGYVHEGKFTSTGIVSIQGNEQDGSDAVTVTAAFPTQSGTLAVTKDIDDKIAVLDLPNTYDAKGSAEDVKEYADKELAKKLDANGWSTNEDGVLAFSKQHDGGVLQSTSINENGVSVQASAGFLHYTASGISGTIDNGYLGTFDVTYDHIKIDDNEFLYPERGGTLAVTTDIEDKITEATKDFGDIVTHDVAEFATAAQGALADTAVQTETFNAFKTENTEAIAAAVSPKLDSKTFEDYIDGKSMSDADLKDYADKAAQAVDTKLTQYSEAHASDYTNKQIDDAISAATGSLGSMSTKDAADYFTKDETAAKIESYAYATDTNAKKYAADAQSAAEAKAAELDAALKAELTGTINGVDAKFSNYVTNDTYNAHTAAQGQVNTGFDSRIASVEAKFGTGEGTVEAQIAAAVKVEEDARKLAVQGVQSEVDALEGRMGTAEGKITALEGASATKTELTNALALKADKSVVDAMYTNAKIDELLATKQDVILPETYDAYGAAAAAETAAKGYADQKLLDFENAYIKADDNGTIDKLNEIAAWIADDEAGATKIISDVATNAANIKTVGEDLDKVELQLNGIAQGNGTVKAAINLAEQNAKDYADGELAKKLDANGWETTTGTLSKDKVTLYSNGSIELGKDDWTTQSSSTRIDQNGIYQGHYDYGVNSYLFPGQPTSSGDNGGKTYTLATTDDIRDAFNGWDTDGEGTLSWTSEDRNSSALISVKDGISFTRHAYVEDGGDSELIITPTTIQGIAYGAIAVKNDITTAISNLDSSVAATAEADGVVSVLTGVTQTDGKLTAKTEVALAKVAKSGSYNDLTDKPTLGALAAKDKVSSDDLSDEVFVFDCGTATTII